MAVEALGSTPRAKVAPWNDPVIRGWVFQETILMMMSQQLRIEGRSILFSFESTMVNAQAMPNCAMLFSMQQC